MSPSTARFRTLAFALAVTLWLFLPTTPVRAQAIAGERAALTGRILDSKSAPVPGATIVVTNEKSQLTFSFTSDANGNYALTIPPGKYSLSISGPDGDTSATLNDLKLSSQKPSTRDIALKPSSEQPQLVGAIGPELAPPTPVEAINQPQPAMAIAPQRGDLRAVGPVGPSGGATVDFVRVTVNAVPGPLGYVSSPALGTATQSLGAQQQALAASQNFNFPSIILYISAVPLVAAPANNDFKMNDVQADQETNRNPLWLDSTFTLMPMDANGQPLPSACTDGRIQILGLLPQQTIAAAKNRTIAEVASGVDDVAGAIASFYPGAAGGAAAATKAMDVVFQDIFPPQPVAYEYSNMNGNCEVGWFFRPNTNSAAGVSGPASILGTQTGIVLLKTSKDVKRIVVTGQTLSSWSKPPTSSSKSLFYGKQTTIGTIFLPDVTNIDYDDITSLAAFPALIPKNEVMKILHFDNDPDFLSFAKANKLVGTTPNFAYVTNASLSAFITAGSDKTPDKPPTPGPAPAPAPKPTTGGSKSGHAPPAKKP